MKVFHINLVVSILLIVGGFIVPPIGVIDGSVLTAVGLLLMFSFIEKLPEAIAAGSPDKEIGNTTARPQNTAKADGFLRTLCV